MFTRHLLIALLGISFLFPTQLLADTVELTGSMSTTVKFQDDFSLTVPDWLKTLTVTIPVPVSGSLFGFSQTLGAVRVVSSRAPDQTQLISDAFGNKYDVDVFKNPTPGNITFHLIVEPAMIDVDLQVPLPYGSVDRATLGADVTPFLRATDNAQSDDPAISDIAHRFLTNSTDEVTVTSKIQEYLQKTLTYDSAEGESDDALSVLQRKSSLCDGWSNLFLALARADGLPARFVGGYSIGGAINYPADTHSHATYTVSSAGQPHSWVEVWFPSKGWVPFEPQSSAGFIDSHHLKVWIGADSESVQSILSWTTSKPGGQDITIDESQAVTQPVDLVNVTCLQTDPSAGTYTVLSRRRDVQTATPKL